MSSGFWVIPDVENIKTPVAIMKEQASALTDGTRGLLQGEVLTKSDGQDINHTLFIKAPALSGYRFRVLSYNHSIVLYPGKFFVPTENTFYNVENEEDFNDVLKMVLSSKEIGNIVSGLMLQARDS